MKKGEKQVVQQAVRTTRRKKGEGLIREYQPGKWNARIVINGKSHDFYGSSEKEVTRKMEALKRKIAQGQTDNRRISYSDFLDEWLEKKKRKLKEQSYIRLEITVDKHVKPEIGFYNIDKLDAAIIQELIDKKAKKLSYSSVKKIYDAVNASMNVARSMGKIIHNPVDLVDMPSQASGIFPQSRNCTNNGTDGKLEIFTDDEIKRFITAANAKFSNDVPIYKNAGLFILMLNTGLRMGEATALKWSDYDPVHNTIRVYSSIIQAKDENGKRILNLTRLKSRDSCFAENCYRCYSLTFSPQA